LPHNRDLAQGACLSELKDGFKEEETMQCQQCHNLNDDDSNFCEQCGQPLQNPKQAPTNGLLKLAAGVGIAALAAWQLSQRQKSSSQKTQPKNSETPTGKVMTCRKCGYTGPTQEEPIMRHISARSIGYFAYYPSTIYRSCPRCGEILN
jgi:hypothetical protein